MSDMVDKARAWDAVAAARADERLKCARDVCMYCGRRALGYGPAEGPNEAGNYVHIPVDGGPPILCPATGIFARAAFPDPGGLVPAGQMARAEHGDVPRDALLRLAVQLDGPT